MNNLSVPLDEFIDLFKFLKGHPYYLARIIEKLKTKKEIFHAIKELLEEENAYVELLVERAIGIKHALEVLRSLAKEENPHDVIDIKDQVISRTLNTLVSYGFLRRVSRGVYEFTDPLLELYLKERRVP